MVNGDDGPGNFKIIREEEFAFELPWLKMADLCGQTDYAMDAEPHTQIGVKKPGWASSNMLLRCRKGSVHCPRG